MPKMKCIKLTNIFLSPIMDYLKTKGYLETRYWIAWDWRHEGEKEVLALNCAMVPMPGRKHWSGHNASISEEASQTLQFNS